MANENLVDIRSLKEDVLVKVEIPTDIYIRLQQLLFTTPGFTTFEDATKALTAVNTKEEDDDPLIYNIRTILWLIGKIEDEADKQGLIVTKKVDKTTAKVF